ncbi:MAG: DNA-binding protein, partial [Candidatus Omnitrophica bacterium]|nr:DNA-binding protein [Candidatus Omnitrophota bacterium]
AAAVTSRELIDKAKEYDGSVVLYEGEAIGEVMMRGDFAWVNVRDSRNAIGIWVPSTVTRTIKSLGSYQRRGDRVLVTGIFHRACRIHGGDLDIHATALSLQEPGSRIPAPLDLGKIRLMINLTIILFLVIIGAMLVRIRLSRKQ